MVEKVKNLNWPFYSNIGLIIANLMTVLTIIFFVMNVKKMENFNVIIYLGVLGLMVTGLLKLNDVYTNESNL